MAATVNFLPWRQMRFYLLLRRWGVLILGLWLVCGATAYVRCLHWQATRAANETHTQAEQQISQQLVLREKQFSVEAQRQAQIQKRLASRQATQDWSRRLLDLSAQLPAQVWLNALSYRDSELSLTGTLTQFSAMTALDSGLKTVSGFQPGRAGKIQRDSAGRWLFQYQLREEVTHGAP